MIQFPTPDAAAKRAKRVEELEAAAAAAEAAANAEQMLDLGGQLERLEAYASAAAVLARAGRMLKPSSLPEWDGSEDVTLVIEQRIRHIGAPIRAARLLEAARRRVSGCIVLAEPRLVPLFKRSFGGLDVVDERAGREDAYARATAVASYETLAQRLVPDGDSLRRCFVPILADDALASSLRAKYPCGPGPVIGIAWSSTNSAKDLPDIASWAAWLARRGGTYISLQYAERAEDIAAFRALGVDVVANPGPDALCDLDWHAAQIASVDQVVTISNTTAHLAGAMGVRTTVLLDDREHLIWPLGSDRTAWYPMTRLIRQRGRGWDALFSELDG